MKQLHPTELYAIEVPIDAIEINHTNCKIHISYKVGNHIDFIDLLDEASNFKILGEVTADEISFDVDKVNKMMVDTKFIDVPMFSGRSFRSLLSANGLFFENPYQSDWDELCAWGHGGFAKDGKTEFEIYNEAQNNLIKGKLVILKKK